ncbi:hypothetical protein CEXT_278171 [Caerostris extrusa]|uniref:Uncharacterized protein n=1 Tax=Caerostris extrusa TaxID=172846 RepID=A0AAV4Q9K1_CAEEX|nr:hypothetical protein CEXT_278171 [Caerostris extrusa]
MVREISIDILKDYGGKKQLVLVSWCYGGPFRCMGLVNHLQEFNDEQKEDSDSFHSRNFRPVSPDDTKDLSPVIFLKIRVAQTKIWI